MKVFPASRRRRLAAGLLLIVVALVAATACGPSRPKPTNFNQALDTDTVTMLDTHVTTQLARQREWTETVNGFLKVNTIFRNLTGGDMHIEIKTVFKDEYGGEIENTNKTWEPVTINAHDDYHYKKLCTNKGGQDYHIFVRLSK